MFDPTTAHSTATPSGTPAFATATPGAATFPGAAPAGAHAFGGATPAGEPDCLRAVISQRRGAPSRVRRALTTWIALLAFLVALGAAADRSEARLSTGTVFEQVANNPVDVMDHQLIDDQIYDRATHCVKNPTKGALALVKWLPAISPRGLNWGINRCEMWGKKSASLHAEGRAIDWHLDVHNAADKAEAASRASSGTVRPGGAATHSSVTRCATARTAASTPRSTTPRPIATTSTSS